MTAPYFIDFEASSMSAIDSYPIEVAIAGPGEEVHSWLIRPAPLWNDWSEKAERVHGIRRETLIREGHDVRDVALALNELVPPVCYCDMPTLDLLWHQKLFKAAGIRSQFSIESIVELFEPYRMALWSSVRRRVIEESQLRLHRAADDVRILHRTWKSIHEAGVEPYTG